MQEKTPAGGAEHAGEGGGVEKADLLSQHQAGTLCDGITVKLRIENRTGETGVLRKQIDAEMSVLIIGLRTQVTLMKR